jgi:hypothetical protein
MIFRILFFVFCLTLGFKGFSQRNLKDSVIGTPWVAIHYGANATSGDLADRFGFLNHIGAVAGYKTSNNFIEYTKDIIDVLHDEWTRTDSEAATHDSPQIPIELVERYNRIQGIHYYDSIVVYDIGPKSKNERVRSRNKYMNQ